MSEDKWLTIADVRRKGNRVELVVGGDIPVSFSAGEAERIGAAMRSCAEDIRGCDATQSDFGVVDVSSGDLSLVELLGHEYGDDAPQVAFAIRQVWGSGSAEALKEVVRRYCPDTTTPVRIPAELCSGESIRFAKMAVIDDILRTHGVEHLGKLNGEFVDYCNAGETYAQTAVFVGDELGVTDWGSIAESDGFQGWNRFSGEYEYTMATLESHQSAPPGAASDACL